MSRQTIVNSFKTKFDRLPRVYIFPLIIGLLILIFSLLQISGTSIGVYDYMFGRADSGDLLAGEPRSVRSDEWAVTTPFTIAQAQDNLPLINQNVGSGQDMSVVVDVPYTDWSVLFRPQNLAFFILPLEIAFAFKWWFLAGALVLGVYVFVLMLYPKRYLLASLLAIFILFNPFIQWWYQTITILPVAYGFLIVVSFFKLVHAHRAKAAIAYGLFLYYLLVCFALLMYPAFQISVVLVMAAVVLAILAAKKEFKLLLRRRTLILLGAVLLASATTVGLFIFQRFESIKATLDTVYPGEREVTSGGFNLIDLLNWPLNYLLLESDNATSLGVNQSEASGFLLFGFIVGALLGVMWWRNRQLLNRTELYIFISVFILSLIIILRLFVPFGDPIYSIIGLDNVPHVRLVMALGIINLIFLMVVVGRKGRALHSIKNIFTKGHVLAFLLMIIYYGSLIFGLVQHYEVASVGPKEAVFLSLICATASTMLLSPYIKLRYAGLGLIVVFALISSALANPLYRGLSLDEVEISNYIKKYEASNDDYWISNDKPYLSSVILASGAEVHGGVNTYPQLDLWQKHFPNQKDIFNRYAHIRFQIDPLVTSATLELIQADSFRVKLSDCDPLLEDLKVGYIVSDVDLGSNLACFGQKDSQIFDQKPLYIYSR